MSCLFSILWFALLAISTMHNNSRVSALNFPPNFWLLSRTSVCNGLYGQETFLTLIGLTGDGHLALMDSNSNGMKVPLTDSLTDSPSYKLTLFDAYELEPSELMASWAKIKWISADPVQNMYFNVSGTNESSLVVQTTTQRHILNKVSVTTLQEGVNSTLVMMSTVAPESGTRNVVGVVNKASEMCLVEQSGDSANCISVKSPVDRGFMPYPGRLIVVFANRSIAVLEYKGANTDLVLKESLKPTDFYICKDDERYTLLVLTIVLLILLFGLSLVLLYNIVSCVLEMAKYSGSFESTASMKKRTKNDKVDVKQLRKGDNRKKPSTKVARNSITSSNVV